MGRTLRARLATLEARARVSARRWQRPPLPWAEIAERYAEPFLKADGGPANPTEEEVAEARALLLAQGPPPGWQLYT